MLTGSPSGLPEARKTQVMQETDNGETETFEHGHGKVAAICAPPEASKA
jgi:hypothetical protein